MSAHPDAITVKTIMEQFIKDDLIKKKLRMICNSKKNDWEKWLQLEIEFFMSSLDGINIEREVQAIPDNRKLKNRSNMFIDLAFRKKRTRQNAYIFLELKCKNNVQSLINGFERDIKKINSLKSCMLDQRSFWCVGFHKNCTDRSIKKINSYVEGWNGFHSVIKLCDCPDDNNCTCLNNKVGFAIL